MTHDLTDEDREKLAGLPIVASVSGGKDSAALSLWLTSSASSIAASSRTRNGRPISRTSTCAARLLLRFGPIDEAAGARGFEELAIHKGMFPSRLKRFCTTELKVRPIQRYIKALDEDVINAVGIRAAESAPRAKMTRWEWSDSFDCWVWRPLLAWTMDDVVAIHKKHGLLPNPLYLKGATRVGCWPCINARKSEITLVAETDPARIDCIRALEQRVGDEAYARAERRAAEGKEPFVFRNRPTMFHSHGRQMANAGNDDKSTWVPDVPIDSIVKWARTSRGGRQFQLDLHEPNDDGCVRWGLCEGHEEEKPVPDFLDPATPMTVVDDYLRDLGMDPKEVGDRGVEAIMEALAEAAACSKCGAVLADAVGEDGRGANVRRRCSECESSGRMAT